MAFQILTTENLVISCFGFFLGLGILQLVQVVYQNLITLLPKLGKDLLQIENWRPISLSACDLKIITKSLANRLKPVLPNLLYEHQGAYIPGRDINFNNRLLRYAKSYAKEHNIDSVVVSLDARKAFDSVSHDYLHKVMEVFHQNSSKCFIYYTVLLNQLFRSMVFCQVLLTLSEESSRGT